MITREEFIALYQERITRRGADKLLDWMTKTDFFTAPASTRYHLACAGGLMEHSAHVYYRLRKVVSSEYGDESPYSEETLAVCGLLHDLCKVNFYKEDIRNVKENGVWVQKPYYTVDEQLPYGHGEKSVLCACRWKKRSPSGFIWAASTQNRGTTMFQRLLKRYHLPCFSILPIWKPAIWTKPDPDFWTTEKPLMSFPMSGFHR